MMKRITMLVISIITVLVILLTTTYAITYKQEELKNEENYTAGILDIVLENDEEGLGEVLNLSDALPIPDAKGMKSESYKFKITNKGNLNYKFNLKIVSTTDSNEVNKNYIKLMVDEENPVILGSKSNGVIKKDLILNPGESQIINIRIWLSEDMPNTEMGKKFSAKIITDGIAEEPPKEASSYLMTLSNGSSNNWKSGDSGLYEVTYKDENGNNLIKNNKEVKDYRYIGATPNNYVVFNEDMYQIIGVFDENTHGVEGEYLVKLIAVNPIVTTTYGSYNTSNTSGVYGGVSNDWTGREYTTKTNTNILLNEYFYNRKNTSNTYGNCSNWTYYYSSGDYKTYDCNTLVGYGIKEEYRNYIETVDWYLQGYTDDSLTNNNMYLCERGMYTGCTTSNNGGGATTTTNKIGLMYVSDYIYASLLCNVGNSSLCETENWVYFGNENLITSFSNTNNSNYVISYGNRISISTKSYRGYNIRPAFYLNSKVKITKGGGSVTNPYKLGL